MADKKSIWRRIPIETEIIKGFKIIYYYDEMRAACNNELKEQAVPEYVSELAEVRNCTIEYGYTLEEVKIKTRQSVKLHSKQVWREFITLMNKD